MPRKPLPSAATPASSRAHPTGRAPAKMSHGQARPALVNGAVGLVWAPPRKAARRIPLHDYAPEDRRDRPPRRPRAPSSARPYDPQRLTSPPAVLEWMALRSGYVLGLATCPFPDGSRGSTAA
jgi:hypothetical protein